MNKFGNDFETLVEGAEALMDSTAKAAGKWSGEARKGATNVLERGRDLYGNVCKRAVKDARATDAVIHDNLYRTVLVGAGVGMILGYLLARRGIFSGR